jgi:hypothetical protein
METKALPWHYHFHLSICPQRIKFMMAKMGPSRAVAATPASLLWVGFVGRMLETVNTLED